MTRGPLLFALALFADPAARIAAGQAPVVAGNLASARDRALDEALRLLVEQALGEALDPQVRVAAARALRPIVSRARGYVRRYRVIEQGEAHGIFHIRIEGDVDVVSLRRDAERSMQTAGPVPAAPLGSASAATAAAAGAPAPTAMSLLLVVRDGGEAAPALLAALRAAGIRADQGDRRLAEPPAITEEARRAGLGAAALAVVSAAVEGPVRGTARLSVRCGAQVKVVGTAGAQQAEVSAGARGFAPTENTARDDCHRRLAADVAERVKAVLSPWSAAAGPRAVTLDVDLVEPAAVPVLLKVLRSLGSVSAAEVRRLAAGRVELRVITRLPAQALAAAAARDGTGELAVTDVQAAGDLVRMKARLAAAPAGNGPPAAAPTLPQPGAPLPAASPHVAPGARLAP